MDHVWLPLVVFPAYAGMTELGNSTNKKPRCIKYVVRGLLKQFYLFVLLLSEIKILQQESIYLTALPLSTSVSGTTNTGAPFPTAINIPWLSTPRITRGARLII